MSVQPQPAEFAPNGAPPILLPPAAAPAASRAREIWIGLPAYSGVLHIPTMRSLFTDILKLTERGHKVHILDDCGNAMIGDCRALMVAEFLESPTATDFVFVDSDVSWEAGALVDLAERPVDFRCAIYPQRKDPIGFSVRWDQTKPELCAEDGLLPIWGCPAGFMMFTRYVAETMTRKYPELAVWTNRLPSESYCALFDPYWTDVTLSDGRVVRTKLGEDFSFCQRWIDCGGQLHVAPEIRMGHTGFKTFTGSLGDWLRDNNSASAATLH